MLISIADLVEMVVIGLTFVSNIGESITIVMKKYHGYTIVIDGSNLVVGESFDTEMLLSKCASHGAVARQVAPDYYDRLVSSGQRAELAATVADLQSQLTVAIDNVRLHDATICKPYDLDSLFVWTVDIESLTVNDHTVVEKSRSRRTTANASVQNKTHGAGRGHRLLQWTIGTYAIRRGQFDGYTLVISDDTFTVSFDDTIVYTSQYSDLANVPALAQSAYEIMYAQINAGESPGRRNLCKMWAMPTVESDTVE